jgi:hypothetical protein
MKPRSVRGYTGNGAQAWWPRNLTSVCTEWEGTIHTKPLFPEDELLSNWCTARAGSVKNGAVWSPKQERHLTELN